MINDQLKYKIEKLFSEKKYDELIAITEKYIQYNERPAGLACLIGTSIILKKQKRIMTQNNIPQIPSKISKNLNNRGYRYKNGKP